MGIGPQWKLRSSSHENQSLSPTSSSPTDLSAQIEIENMLGTEPSNSPCQVCGWCSITSKAIASGQSPDANYLFIHEHASDSDNVTVSVLTAAADALLNGILRELRLKLGVSANVVCIVKTKSNALADKRVNAQDGEILACVSCVKKQIELLHPSVIISLGNTPAISLLGVEGSISINDLRGTLHRYEETALIVTHELDYLLKHPKEKHGLWLDLCFAMNSIQIH